MDPAPRPETTGPRLQTWLEEHLLGNLEQASHCVHPRRLFPLWLGEAKLRGAGSTIQHHVFPAAAAEEGRSGEEEQLRTCAGRLLWKEMWGGHVRTAGREERWWWDEAGIIEECRGYGTCWEYTVIDAVKEG